MQIKYQQLSQNSNSSFTTNSSAVCSSATLFPFRVKILEDYRSRLLTNLFICQGNKTHKVIYSYKLTFVAKMEPIPPSWATPSWKVRIWWVNEKRRQKDVCITSSMQWTDFQSVHMHKVPVWHHLCLQRPVQKGFSWHKDCWSLTFVFCSAASMQLCLFIPVSNLASSPHCSTGLRESAKLL